MPGLKHVRASDAARLKLEFLRGPMYALVRRFNVTDHQVFISQDSVNPGQVHWRTSAFSCTRDAHTKLQEKLTGYLCSNSSSCMLPILFQDNAVQHVSDIIAEWSQQIHPSKPLVLVLFGPAGCGKSLLIEKLGTSLFWKLPGAHQVPGLLRLDMSHEVQADNEFLRDELLPAIAQQLYYCPSSLIVLDGLQSFTILSLLSPYLTSAKPESLAGYTVDFRRAMFVFTTQLGSPILTETYHQYLSNGNTREFFSGADLSPFTSQPDFSSLKPIPALIPLLPMSQREVISAYSYLLENFKKHQFGLQESFILRFDPDMSAVSACLSQFHVDDERAPNGIHDILPTFEHTIASRVSALLDAVPNDKLDTDLIIITLVATSTPFKCEISVSLTAMAESTLRLDTRGSPERDDANDHHKSSEEL
jgi:hypothetical protein